MWMRPLNRLERKSCNANLYEIEMSSPTCTEDVSKMCEKMQSWDFFADILQIFREVWTYAASKSQNRPRVQHGIVSQHGEICLTMHN